MICIELTLTKEGSQRFGDIISFVSMYIQKALSWLDDDMLPLFSEVKTMSELSFKYSYKVPD